jgi:hypothetical protein
MIKPEVQMTYFAEYKWDSNVLLVEGDSEGLSSFLDKVASNWGLAFNRLDGEGIRFVRANEDQLANEIRMRLMPQELEAINEAIAGLIQSEKSCHAYIDIHDNYTLILSLNGG